VCDCAGLSFTGAACQIPLVCEPNCKNGGTCVLLTDGTGNTTCNCPPGFGGSIDCSVANTPTSVVTQIIIGCVVGGGGLLIIVAAAIIIAYLKRPEKREGATLYP